MLINNWTARKTDDNKVSVVDVIADVTKKNYKYASNLYKKLVQEERVPQCEDRALAPRQHSLASSNPGSQTTRRGGSRRHELTPVATAAEMVEIVWQLPGTADFRRNCAQLTVRYLGGDESLIGEVQANRRAQEELAVTQPDHPARAFGEAVEQTNDIQSASPNGNEIEAARNSRLQTLTAAWTLAQAIGSTSQDRLRAQAQRAIDDVLLPEGESREEFVDAEIILRERAYTDDHIRHLAGELGKDLKLVAQREGGRQSCEQDFGRFEKHQVGLYHRRRDAKLIEDVLCMFKERPLYKRVVLGEAVPSTRRQILETQGRGRNRPQAGRP
jgi:hypothetical protein